MAKRTPSPPPGDWHQLRLWQIQPIRDLLLIALVLGVLYLGYHLRIVTVPILLALALAYLFEPLVQFILKRTRFFSRQGIAAAIIVVAGLVVIVPTVVGIGFAVVQGASLAGSIATHSTNLVTSIQGDENQRRDAYNKLPQQWRAASRELLDLKREVDDYRARSASPAAPTTEPGADGQPRPPAAEPDHIPEWKVSLYTGVDWAINWIRANATEIGKTVGQHAIGTGATAFTVAGKTLTSAGVLLFTAGLTAFFFFFFCTGWGKVLAFWESLIPERKKSRVIELLKKMDRVIAGFIRGRLIICGILGLFVTVMYFVIGVPVPLILGPIVGLFFLVPFLHVVAMPLAMIAMLLDPSGPEWQTRWWWVIGAPIGVNLLCQVLDDYILTPLIQGKNTEMSIPSILFASIAGGALAGFYGLLLAIPAAACIRILLKEVFMPRFAAWAQGKEKDFLPISRDDSAP
ncbi:MAG: AI-2E family transporter [Phycisphaeraceae bacterium]|nr:AI-2E family transporter [Phycisphaeraceae bacterium]